MKHIIIYSHGFAVRKDDRGLFTDIAATMPDLEHIMFDYNTVNEQEKTILVTPFTEQAEMLRKTVARVHKDFPDAVIDIIAHSQGCIAVALARPQGIRKVILLAPPTELDPERRIQKYAARPNTTIDPNGMSRIPGSDGYTKLVPAEFWQSMKGLNAAGQYGTLSHSLDLLLVKASNDQVVTESLPVEAGLVLRTEEVNADHDFTGEARQEVIDLIAQELE